VGIWLKAFRFSAMFLLLFVAVEVLACDLLPSDDCYISSRLPTTPDKDHGQSSGDTCLCCCQHMAVTIPLLFVPQETVTPTPPEATVEQPLFAPSYIDHPPRLS
jgi:hypothetical protein